MDNNSEINMVKKLPKSKTAVSTKFKNHSILDYFPFLDNLKINLSPSRVSNNNDDKTGIRKEISKITNSIINNERKINHVNRKFTKLKRRRTSSESSSSFENNPEQNSNSAEIKKSISDSSSSIDVSSVLKYHKKNGIQSPKIKDSNSESNSSKEVLNYKFGFNSSFESLFENYNNVESKKPI